MHTYGFTVPISEVVFRIWGYLHTVHVYQQIYTYNRKFSFEYIMFALMREYISTYLYTVYDVMATNINVVL